MTGGFPIRRIAVGVDGSQGSGRALTWALDAAAALGAEVEAVFAYDVPLAWIDVGSDAEATIVEHAARKARDELHAILAEAVDPGRGVTVHPVVMSGLAADVLVEASRTAELLVVGSRGRGGFTGLLLGSVSQRCVERAQCPVVVVPGR